jgi:hypothetical protein
MCIFLNRNPVTEGSVRTKANTLFTVLNNHEDGWTLTFLDVDGEKGKGTALCGFATTTVSVLLCISIHI